jgi:hypothetical protein
MHVSTNVLQPNGLSSDADRDEIVARVVRARRQPTPQDRKFTSGTMWIDRTGGEAWVLIGMNSGQAIWKKIT